MGNIFTVANWFLQKGNIDHKKLQKLCYYSQSWSLALNNQKLFDDKFEAWAHGAVSRLLWDRLKKYCQDCIPKNEFHNEVEEIKDEKTLKLLNRVWNTYGKYDGIDLECMTQRETPWINARKGIPIYQASTNEISESDMKNYYYSIYSGNGIGE